MKLPPTIVNQPPINLISPENTADPDHKLARVLVAAHFSPSYLERLNRGDVPTNKLDIITDGHIYDLHLTAHNHGCEPSDIALEERTKQAGKVLSPSKVMKNWCPDCNQYVTALHSGLTCEQYLAKLEVNNKRHAAKAEKKRATACVYNKAQRDIERDEKHSAREAEWQRELATWSPFISRNPISATQVAVRDPEWLKQQPTSLVLDYSPTWDNLPVPPPPIDLLANVRICVHRLKRSFTFSTGETISLCADCGMTFGHNVLEKVATSTTPRTQHTNQHWEDRLEAEGLPADLPVDPIVSYNSPEKMGNIEHAIAAHTTKSDYRASQIRKEVKANTEMQRSCLGCGMLFLPNHKSRMHCTDNCRKQHHKKLKRRRDGSSHVPSTINRSTNYE